MRKTPPFDFVAQSKGGEAEILREVTMRREEPAPAPVPVAAPVRWWRLRPWSRNHLMRRSDRFEATLVMLTAVLVLLLIPVAAAFGTATHTRLEQQAQALRAGVHHVPAVLLEDTYLAPGSPEYTIRPVGSRNTARARWTTPGGDHVAAVSTDTPAQAGQTVTISVDADGNLTGPIPDSREKHRSRRDRRLRSVGTHGRCRLAPYGPRAPTVHPEPVAALGTRVETVRHTTDIEPSTWLRPHPGGGWCALGRRARTSHRE